MKKHLILKTFLSLSVAFALSDVSMAANTFKIKPMNKTTTPGFYQIVPGEIIVKFKSGVAENDIDSINNGFGAKVKNKSYKKGKFKVLTFNGNKSVDEMIAKYQENNKVEYATANLICNAQLTPSDPGFLYQWNFGNESTGGINMESAWDMVPGGSAEVVVAVLDTGVAYDAPDFSTTNFTAGYDFINSDDNPYDDNSHGTHVAGTIAQSTNNPETNTADQYDYRGVAGIAYNTSIMPVKVLNVSGGGDAASLANGLYWATDNGADVINMSLSFPPGTRLNQLRSITAAVEYAYNNGVTIIAAAGNDTEDSVNYPARYPEVIAVGATTYAKELAWYSNYGTGLDIVAPGGDTAQDLNGDGNKDGIVQQTFGTDPDDPDTYGLFSYFLYQGTSMAAPHVSGVAALIIAQNGNIGPDNVREILLTSALDIGIPDGPGLLDASASLQDEIVPPETNQPPVADPGGTYHSDENGFVFFDGTGSTDPDDSPDALTFYWEFGDDSSPHTDAKPTHEYLDSGTYIVTLTVYDGEAYSAAVTTTADVVFLNDEEPVLPPLDCTDYTSLDTCVAYPECRYHPRKGCLNRN